MPSPPKNLDELARSLLANGPVKTLNAAPKRVRVGLGGSYVADTTRAVYVWEHKYYPTYYLPLESFIEGALSYPDSSSSSSSSSTEGYRLAALSAGDATTDRVIVFREGVLADLVRVECNAVAAWFGEDARGDGHPRDRFKRGDVVFSSRPVRVSVHGTEVAHSTSSFQLYETGLPVRFYLPITSVRLELLRESATVTACPYKGEANYYDVVIKGVQKGAQGGGNEERLKDIVWYYKTPKLECAAIAGCLCFYNEKVDIELDGEMLERPKTPFS